MQMWLMTSRDEEGQILVALDKNVRAPITQGGGFAEMRTPTPNTNASPTRCPKKSPPLRCR